MCSKAISISMDSHMSIKNQSYNKTFFSPYSLPNFNQKICLPVYYQSAILTLKTVLEHPELRFPYMTRGKYYLFKHENKLNKENEPLRLRLPMFNPPIAIKFFNQRNN